MGTPSFAVPTLEALQASEAHDVVAVYTRPDAASGRGKRLRAAPVKQRALELGLAVHTPKTLRDADVLAGIEALRPDAVVVAAYGCILPPELLRVPRYGCLNVHGSLLPRWRGAAPVQRAILSGDESVGVCVMQMQAGLDTGAYHAIASVPVADRTADELSAQLARLGAQGLLEALALIEAGRYEWTEQDESRACYADKLDKRDTLLAPTLCRREFLRRVQASSPSAPARCVVCGTRLSVIRAHPSSRNCAEGHVELGKKHVCLGVHDGAVELDVLKPESKREMTAAQWAAGVQASAPRSWTALPHTTGTP